MIKPKSFPNSLHIGIVAASVLLAAVTVLSLTPGEATSAAKASRAQLTEHDRDRVQLPGGLDPMDIVRAVQRNRSSMGVALSPLDTTLSSPSGGEAPTAGSALPADGIGPAFDMGGNPSYGPGVNDQRKPAIASDGISYLIVWEDYRAGSYSDIYGARVSVDGTLLDPPGIAISTAPRYQGFPAIAFDGINYLVVWQDTRDPSGTRIYGTRVSTGGVVLDPNGIPISTAAGNQGYPAIAFNGTNCLAVWEDTRSGTTGDIYGARISTDGSVLDPNGIAINSSASSQSDPDVASDGTDWFVVWSDPRTGLSYDIYGTRVSADGSVLDPNGITISSAAKDQLYPSVAFNGADYFVVWQDFRSNWTYDIYCTRVSRSGTVLDPAGIAISTAINHHQYPSVVFDGTNCLVVWADKRNGPDYDIFAARVDTAGSVIDTGGIPVSIVVNNQWWPATAAGGTNCLIVWEDSRNGAKTDIYGARLSKGGNVLDPAGMSVSTSANDEWLPAIAFNGTNYLVVWEDYRAGLNSDIYGVRVSQSGAVLDPAGIAVSTAPGNQNWPAVASDGTNYLVVWMDSRSGIYPHIYGTRITQGGTVLDPNGIAICTAANDQNFPAVAFAGTNYLVAWQDYRSGSSYDIYGARVSQGGAVLDPAGIAICTAASDQWSPAMASNGASCLVVWQDHRSGSSYDIYGARVGADGSVLDQNGIAISTAASWQMSPAATSDGTDYLVVWQDARISSWDIYGARVTQGGSVLDPDGIAISIAANIQQNPATAFDGTNYLAIWDDDRSGSSHDIWGARVHPDGNVLDPAGLAICAEAYNQLFPDLARTASSGFLISYQGFTPPPVYGSYRTRGSFFRGGPIGLDFASASASIEQGHVTLSWQMAIEAAAWSFRVKRSEHSEFSEGEFLTLDMPIIANSAVRFSCTDYSVLAGKTYSYMIVLVGSSGDEEYGPIVAHVCAVPTAFRVYQSCPNPFNPVCTIRYEVPRKSRVSLQIFDVSGSPVRTLFSASREPGAYTVFWDGRANNGGELPSGVYFYQLRADEFVATGKTVLLR